MAYLGKLREDQKATERTIAELVIYSEGAISWNEAWMLSMEERNLLVTTLNKYNSLKSGKPQNEML